VAEYVNVSISKREFRGCVIWDAEYSGRPHDQGRLVIYEVAPDSYVIDRHRAERQSGPGGYYVAGYTGSSELSFGSHYKSVDELRDGVGTRKHPSLANFRVAVELAVRELFPS
jgi:hypothetical protein